MLWICVGAQAPGRSQEDAGCDIARVRRRPCPASSAHAAQDVELVTLLRVRTGEASPAADAQAGESFTWVAIPGLAVSGRRWARSCTNHSTDRRFAHEPPAGARAQGRPIDCPVFVGWSLSASADVVPVFVDIAITIVRTTRIFRSIDPAKSVQGYQQY